MPAPGSFSGKNLVIALLVAVVAVQGYFLLRGPSAPQAPAVQGAQSQLAPPQPVAPPASDKAALQVPGQAQAPATQPAAGDKPRIVSFTVDERGRNIVYFGFNLPVGEGQDGGPLAQAPFDLEPKAKGEWLWLSPWVLAFQLSDKAKFDPATSFTFTARPERMLSSGTALDGRAVFTLHPQTMRVREVRTELEPVAGKPGLVVVKGRVDFSKPVDDQEFKGKLVLKDPKLGWAGPCPWPWPRRNTAPPRAPWPS